MNQTLSSCSCPLLYHISVWLEPSEPRRGIFFTYVDQADRRAADARCRARVDGGGMGAALMAFLGAELKSGIEIVTTALNLEEHIHDCTLVITGEGRIDSQSIHGKVPIGVANVAKKYHKPVIGIAGSLTNDVGVVHQHGIDAVFSVLTSIGTLDEALRGAYDNICRASRNIAATLAIGMRNAG